MKFGVIVAARTGSNRLPAKALLPLSGKAMIIFLLDRIKASKFAEKIIFATTDLEQDDELVRIVEHSGFEVFRGANEDVVKRFVDCAQKYDLEYVVRITGDCPFVDAETLDFCLEQCDTFDQFDLASTKGSFPVGIDYEVYNVSTMKRLHETKELSKEDREHLTKYIYDNGKNYVIKQIFPKEEWKNDDIEFTVDVEKDYKFALNVVNEIGRTDFSMDDLLKKARECR